MTKDKTTKGNFYGVPVTVTIKGNPDYTPKEGDIMADDWVIPADGTPPFRVSGETE